MDRWGRFVLRLLPGVEGRQDVAEFVVSEAFIGDEIRALDDRRAPEGAGQGRSEATSERNEGWPVVSHLPQSGMVKVLERLGSLAPPGVPLRPAVSADAVSVHDCDPLLAPCGGVSVDVAPSGKLPGRFGVFQHKKGREGEGDADVLSSSATREARGTPPCPTIGSTSCASGSNQISVPPKGRWQRI